MEGEALDIKTLPHPIDQNIVATNPNLTALHNNNNLFIGMQAVITKCNNCHIFPKINHRSSHLPHPISLAIMAPYSMTHIQLAFICIIAVILMADQRLWEH